MCNSIFILRADVGFPCGFMVKMQNIGTDRLEQMVQTQIRLLLQEQFDLGIHHLASASYRRLTSLRKKKLFSF